MFCSLMRALVHGLGNQTRVTSEQTPRVQSFDEAGLRVEEAGSRLRPVTQRRLRLGQGATLNGGLGDCYFSARGNRAPLKCNERGIRTPRILPGLLQSVNLMAKGQRY